MATETPLKCLLCFLHAPKATLNRLGVDGELHAERPVDEAFRCRAICGVRFKEPTEPPPAPKAPPREAAEPDDNYFDNFVDGRGF